MSVCLHFFVISSPPCDICWGQQSWPVALSTFQLSPLPLNNMVMSSDETPRKDAFVYLWLAVCSNQKSTLHKLLSDPSGTDLTVVFSSSSRCKPIVNKQPHSSYFSIATHIKYRFRKLMTRTIQWWPRDDTDKDTHKDKYEDKDKDIQEESLPIYISLRILSSNEYI